MAGEIRRRAISEADRARLMGQVDWPRVQAMTEAEVDAARRSDPDALPPMTEQEIDTAKGEVIRRLRGGTGLSQVAFSTRYGIPLGTLRDWEQGKSVPDATARTYLRVIQRAPSAVAAALEQA